ncbi:MAG: hypothetical protein GX027_09425 [Clostridiaceae bacterium]|nr:hypothetical protein [Clostridiaceae bacterium]
MEAGSDKRIQLEVSLSGRFNASLGQVPLFKNAKRSRQVINLFVLLLLHRFENISQERLIEALWPDDECEDPVNALKNLVYRLRKIISDHGTLDGNDCVVSKHGAYAWNCDIPCVIDVEEMEKLWQKAKDEHLSVPERIDLYKEAISLYKGRFMEDFYFEGWVAPVASYYQNIYMNLLHEVIKLLNEEKRYEEITTLCEATITMEPYEETLHENLLKSLINSGKKSRALDHYNYISKKFYKDLEVKLSDSIRCLYKELINDLKSSETDITTIKEEMNDPESNGAFLCDYEIFKNVYRLESRSAERAGQSVFLCLLTMRSAIDINRNEVMVIAMDKLEKVIVSSLRKGDVVSRFSPTQFILLLPLSYENGEKVISRILDRFRKEHKNPLIKIDVNLEPVI